MKTRPTYQRTDANLYPLERQLTKASEPSFDLEGGAKGQDSQPTISHKLVSHCKTLGSIISELKALLGLAILL